MVGLMLGVVRVLLGVLGVLLGVLAALLGVVGLLLGLEEGTVSVFLGGRGFAICFFMSALMCLL